MIYDKKEIILLCKQGLYAEAHELCDRFIEENENNYRAYSGKSFVYAHQKKFNEAIDCIDRAINSKAEPAFLFKKIRWLIEIGEYLSPISLAEEAIEISKAVSFDSYIEDFYFYKAYCEMKLSNYTECFKSLEYVSDDYCSWIEGKLWLKENIKNSVIKE